MGKTIAEKIVYRNFYPVHFKDFILLELIKAQKELRDKEVYEKEFQLNEKEMLKISMICESRNLKFKIEYLAKLLTH